MTIVMGGRREAVLPQVEKRLQTNQQRMGRTRRTLIRTQPGQDIFTLRSSCTYHIAHNLCLPYGLFLVIASVADGENVQR